MTYISGAVLEIEGDWIYLRGKEKPYDLKNFRETLARIKVNTHLRLGIKDGEVRSVAITN